LAKGNAMLSRTKKAKAGRVTELLRSQCLLISVAELERLQWRALTIPATAEGEGHLFKQLSDEPPWKCLPADNVGSLKILNTGLS
jgi:hypothetical protein